MSERLRRMREEDRGFTLVELLIAMGIFGLLMALVFNLLIEMMYQSNDNLARTRAVEQARLGISQIDRQIRSGNVILDPAMENPANAGLAASETYYSLRVYTQEDGGDMCVQWRVLFPDAASEYGSLQFREWEAGDPSSVTSWANVANNVVAATGTPDLDDPETWPPFWVDTSLSADARTTAQRIRITLRMGDPSAREDAKPATVSSVVTGRNTVFQYSALHCADVPAA
ncbi:type II secretion system protein [Demequina gelatinilytica]|uniref:type II secretion system protein n=1 Tax=Demequina gelatinilytica TaxID=1638980 RepID=UPI0009E2FDA5|nr:type II secretion system protein [Demequina gelatinilytica]